MSSVCFCEIQSRESERKICSTHDVLKQPGTKCCQIHSVKWFVWRWATTEVTWTQWSSDQTANQRTHQNVQHNANIGEYLLYRYVQVSRFNIESFSILSTLEESVIYTIRRKQLSFGRHIHWIPEIWTPFLWSDESITQQFVSHIQGTVATSNIQLRQWNIQKQWWFVATCPLREEALWSLSSNYSTKGNGIRMVEEKTSHEYWRMFDIFTCPSSVLSNSCCVVLADDHVIRMAMRQPNLVLLKNVWNTRYIYSVVWNVLKELSAHSPFINIGNANLYES